jgi:hypothetical protein
LQKEFRVEFPIWGGDVKWEFDLGDAFGEIVITSAPDEYEITKGEF